MKIAIGCDHGGFQLKGEVARLLSELGVEYTDFGCFSQESVDYPEYAAKVARSVASGEHPLGILLCGTGLGVMMAANKVKGIRAVHCHDTFSARMAREHNDANILAMGGRVIGPDLAKEVVKVFLTTRFSGDERHKRRIAQLMALEG